MTAQAFRKIESGLLDAINMAEAPLRVAQIGHMLYGNSWPRVLADQLRVTHRFTQRIQAAALAREPYDIPPGFLRDVRALAERRAVELQAASEALRGNDKRCPECDSREVCEPSCRIQRGGYA